MEISQEENGKYAARILSNTTSTGAQIQRLPSAGGRTQFNSSFTLSKHMGFRKVKFMCSSAGKILPRPSDMKLRYVGGETRMVSLPRDINYEAFNSKMMELYGPDIFVKYQLPEEDLDALVSVSSDEDFENMLEECDRLSTGEGSSKLRVFIFLASELETHDLSDMPNFRSSERKFVDAINSLSGDSLPGMHNTAKLYPNSDSFNDAYKAWNGIQSQDKGSLFSKNPYSEVLPLEDYVSSGEFHMYESFVPDQLQSSTSPFSHSAFMGQPIISNTFAIANVLGDGLNSTGGSSFFGQGVGHRYKENHWAISSQMHVQKPLTTDDRRKEMLYKAEPSFAEYSSDKDNGVQMVSQDLLSDDRKVDNAFRVDQEFFPEHAMEQTLAESPFRRVESADDLTSSISQLHSDPFVLSPGTFLQKHLMSSPPIVTPSQQQKYIDSPISQILDANSMQPFSMSSSVEIPQRASHDHLQQDQWERLPVYDSSIALDEESQMLGQPTDQSWGMGSSTALEGPPLSRESSAAVFPTSSAPPPPGWKPQIDRGDEIEESSQKSSRVHLPEDNIALLGSSGRNIVSSDKMMEEKVQMSIPEQTLAQNFRKEKLNFVQEESPFSSSYGLKQESLMNREQVMSRQPSSEAIPVLASAAERVRPFTFQSREDSDQFLLSLPRQHSPDFSLSTKDALSFSQLDSDAICQHGNENFDTLSHFDEVSPSSLVESSHKLDMLSDLLNSCRLTECLAAPSSTVESFRSRSACSLHEDLDRQQGVRSTSRVGLESLLAADEGLDLPLSIEGNSHFSSFDTNLNSLPSNEQFDRVLISPFPSDFDDRTSIFAEPSIPRIQESASLSVPHPTQVPSFTLLIESWEATLLQDENEQDNVTQQHLMQEQAQEQVATPTFDQEIGVEESPVEFEEVEEFQSFDHGPMNGAAIAEQEAISRGLQIIRNCDLEELRELGSGTFGTVYHGKWRGTDVAIKRIKASCFNGRAAERDRLVADFWREAYILGQLHHPNVVAFYGVVPDGPGGTLATVTEYMVNGSLKQVLQNKDRSLDRRKRLLIAMDAAFGMEYLHGKNVVHFDIKCENLLVNLRDTQRPICKVGDLGLSKVKQQTFVSGGVRGTLPWMAPELLNGSSSLVSEKVDVFSFGIVMWELLTGEEPYANMHYGAIIGGIVNNTLRPPVPRWCDPAWKALMEKCWAADPNDRPTFLEIARALRAMEASLAAKGPSQARILEMFQ